MGGGLAYGTAVVGTLLAMVAGRIWSRVRRKARLHAVALDVTARYARLLAVKQKQLVVHDGYGNYQLQPWIEHVDYFIEHVICVKRVISVWRSMPSVAIRHPGPP